MSEKERASKSEGWRERERVGERGREENKNKVYMYVPPSLTPNSSYYLAFIVKAGHSLSTYIHTYILFATYTLLNQDHTSIQER